MCHQQLDRLVMDECIVIEFKNKLGDVRKVGIEKHFLGLGSRFSLPAEQKLIDLDVDGFGGEKVFHTSKCNTDGIAKSEVCDPDEKMPCS